VLLAVLLAHTLISGLAALSLGLTFGGFLLDYFPCLATIFVRDGDYLLVSP
jgi:hypothetical protein